MSYDAEVMWWDGFLRDEPPHYPHFVDWKLTDVGDRPCEWAQHMPLKGDVAALDFGSGPLLRWGDQTHGGRVHWTCVDACEAEYARMRGKYNRISRGTHFAVRAEHLLSVYGEGFFDFAIASNSLDHSEDPFACLDAIVSVTRGKVVVTGFQNEGSQAHGQGLHKWDTNAADGALLIKQWNEKEGVMVREVQGRRVILARHVSGRRPSFEVVIEGIQ